MSVKKLYQQSESVSDHIFRIIQFWTPFTKQIIGAPLQLSIDKACIYLINSLDSHQKTSYLEKAYQNITQTLVWLDKSRRRKLVNRRDYQHLYNDLNAIQDLISQHLAPKKSNSKNKSKS